MLRFSVVRLFDGENDGVVGDGEGGRCGWCLAEWRDLGLWGENCFFSRRHVRASLLVAARGNEGFASGLKCTRCRIPAFLLFSCDVRAAAWPRERAYWSPVAAGDAPPRAATFHHFCRDLIAALNSAELLTLLCRATNRYNVFVFFLLTLRKELFQLLDTVADTSGRGTLS